MHRNVKYGIEDEEVFYKLDGIKALACFAEVSIRKSTIFLYPPKILFHFPGIYYTFLPTKIKGLL